MRQIIFITFTVIIGVLVCLPLAISIGIMASANSISEFWRGIFAGIREYRAEITEQKQTNKDPDPNESVWDRHIARLDAQNDQKKQ